MARYRLNTKSDLWSIVKREDLKALGDDLYLNTIKQQIPELLEKIKGIYNSASSYANNFDAAELVQTIRDYTNLLDIFDVETLYRSITLLQWLARSTTKNPKIVFYADGYDVKSGISCYTVNDGIETPRILVPSQLEDCKGNILTIGRILGIERVRQFWAWRYAAAHNSFNGLPVTTKEETPPTGLNTHCYELVKSTNHDTPIITVELSGGLDKSKLIPNLTILFGKWHTPAATINNSLQQTLCQYLQAQIDELGIAEQIQPDTKLKILARENITSEWEDRLTAVCGLYLLYGPAYRTGGALAGMFTLQYDEEDRILSLVKNGNTVIRSVYAAYIKSDIDMAKSNPDFGIQFSWSQKQRDKRTSIRRYIDETKPDQIKQKIYLAILDEAYNSEILHKPTAGDGTSHLNPTATSALQLIGRKYDTAETILRVLCTYNTESPEADRVELRKNYTSTDYRDVVLMTIALSKLHKLGYNKAGTEITWPNKDKYLPETTDKIIRAFYDMNMIAYDQRWSTITLLCNQMISLTESFPLSKKERIGDYRTNLEKGVPFYEYTGGEWTIQTLAYDAEVRDFSLIAIEAARDALHKILYEIEYTTSDIVKSGNELLNIGLQNLAEANMKILYPQEEGKKYRDAKGECAHCPNYNYDKFKDLLERQRKSANISKAGVVRTTAKRKADTQLGSENTKQRNANTEASNATSGATNNRQNTSSAQPSYEPYVFNETTEQYAFTKEELDRQEKYRARWKHIGKVKHPLNTFKERMDNLNTALAKKDKDAIDLYENELAKQKKTVDSSYSRDRNFGELFDAFVTNNAYGLHNTSNNEITVEQQGWPDLDSIPTSPKIFRDFIIDKYYPLQKTIALAANPGQTGAIEEWEKQKNPKHTKGSGKTPEELQKDIKALAAIVTLKR